MPLTRLKPAGTAPEPLALTASVVLVESKVPSEVEQLLVVQTSNVTFPVSWVSGSVNVAVRVGVTVFRRAVSAGLTRLGAEVASVPDVELAVLVVRGGERRAARRLEEKRRRPEVGVEILVGYAARPVPRDDVQRRIQLHDRLGVAL